MKKLREKFLEVSTSNEGSPPWVRLALPARQGDALPITGLDHVRPPVTFALSQSPYHNAFRSIVSVDKPPPRAHSEIEMRGHVH